MPEKPVIVFVWPNMHVYGGVHTFLLDCLQRLPGMGFRPYVFDVGRGQGPLDEYLKGFGPAIQRFIPFRDEGDGHYWQRVHTGLRDLSPLLVVFIESRYAEDVLKGLPEDVAAINLCLVDRPDEKYYRHARALAPRMKLIAGNSARIVARLRDELPADLHSRIRYLPIGVEAPPDAGVRSLHDPIRLIFMARLQYKQKRAQDLVPFARELAALRVDFHLSIVGQGEAADFLQHELSELISSGTVEMLPVVGPPARQLLNDYDVSLLFSEYEGQPMTVLDALVRGIVPVVSDVKSGMADILKHGENGLLFPIGRPDIAARLVQAIANNREYFASLSRGALELGRHFIVDETMLKLAQIIRESLSEMPAINPWDGWLPAPGTSRGRLIGYARPLLARLRKALRGD